MSANNESSLERQLCISCLAPNLPDAHFCVSCGAPLDSYSATAPFERILAQGYGFRSAVTGRPRLVVVVGMWILFFPGVLTFILRLGFVLFCRPPLSLEDLVIVLYAFAGVVLIFRVTKNYLTIPPVHLAVTK